MTSVVKANTTKTVISTHSPNDYGSIKVEPLKAYEAATYTIILKNQSKNNVMFSVKCGQQIDINSHLVSCSNGQAVIYVKNNSSIDVDIEIVYFAF